MFREPCQLTAFIIIYLRGLADDESEDWYAPNCSLAADRYNIAGTQHSVKDGSA